MVTSPSPRRRRGAPPTQRVPLTTRLRRRRGRAVEQRPRRRAVERQRVGPRTRRPGRPRRAPPPSRRRARPPSPASSASTAGASAASGAGPPWNHSPFQQRALPRSSVAGCVASPLERMVKTLARGRRAVLVRMRRGCRGLFVRCRSGRLDCGTAALASAAGSRPLPARGWLQCAQAAASQPARCEKDARSKVAAAMRLPQQRFLQLCGA